MNIPVLDDKTIEAACKDMATRFPQILGGCLVKIILYGSCARGDYKTRTGGQTMNKSILSFDEIRDTAEPIAKKHKAAKVYLFGSYARNEATPDSDIDFLIVGESGFAPSSIFIMQRELCRAFGKDVDAYEVRELNDSTEFYRNVMRDRRQII